MKWIAKEYVHSWGSQQKKWFINHVTVIVTVIIIIYCRNVRCESADGCSREQHFS